MPLSKFRLAVLARYYKLYYEPLREFPDADHPVVLMRCRHRDTPSWGNSPWRSLMCPCDLKWKWSFNWRGKPRWFTMIMTGGITDCPFKEKAREVVRAELRQQHKETWAKQPLADAAYLIWQKHLAGEYLGEHNVGTLYVQDMERLLGTIPKIVTCTLAASTEQGNTQDTEEGERLSFSYPSPEILAAMHELRKRKLLDLSGMILVLHEEQFCFPDELHHQFAYWIEKPLGWPNGDAGDGFMYQLYEQLADKTGWTSGESVFSEKNFPALSPEWKTALPKWLARLDPRLVDDTVVDKSVVLGGLSVETWVNWLVSIKQEVIGSEE